MWEGGKHNTKHKSIQKNLMMEICFFCGICYVVSYVFRYRLVEGKKIATSAKKMYSLVALTLTARGSTLVDRI